MSHPEPRRRPCPVTCDCLCHDTGGGVHDQQGKPCSGKEQAPLENRGVSIPGSRIYSCEPSSGTPFLPPPNVVDAPGGPRCGCGRPPRLESGSCGQCDARYPEGDIPLPPGLLKAPAREQIAWITRNALEILADECDEPNGGHTDLATCHACWAGNTLNRCDMIEADGATRRDMKAVLHEMGPAPSDWLPGGERWQFRCKCIGGTNRVISGYKTLVKTCVGCGVWANMPQTYGEWER